MHSPAKNSSSAHAVHVSSLERSVRSQDGTRIGYMELGNGPGLVFVHGSISSHADWMPVAKILSRHFTCMVMDRRGRGLSDDHSAYAIEREYEDVLALLDAAGPDAVLLAHSFGGLVALGAAMQRHVNKFVLYEPPLPVSGAVAGENLPLYEELVAADRHDEALIFGLEKFVRLPMEQILFMRTLSAWPRLLATVPTWGRELRAIDDHGPEVEHYEQIGCPTLLLMGSLSAPHPLRNGSLALQRTLRRARALTMEGQGHTAMRMATQKVAHSIEEFLLEKHPA